MTVKYNPVGDNLPTVLSTAVQGGNPPDIAAIAQVGLLSQFAKAGKLKPLDSAKDASWRTSASRWSTLGTVEGGFYGLLWKANNSSTVWYNVKAVHRRGCRPPEDVGRADDGGRHDQASGLQAYSIAGADGWTLTDLFENIYMRTAGPEKYDQLSRTRSSGPIRRSRKRSPRWRRSTRTATTSPAARPAPCRRTSRPRSATSSPRRRRPRW